MSDSRQFGHITMQHDPSSVHVSELTIFGGQWSIAQTVTPTDMEMLAMVEKGFQADVNDKKGRSSSSCAYRTMRGTQTRVPQAEDEIKRKTP